MFLIVLPAVCGWPHCPTSSLCVYRHARQTLIEPGTAWEQRGRGEAGGRRPVKWLWGWDWQAVFKWAVRSLRSHVLNRVCPLVSSSWSPTEMPKPHECCCTSFTLGDNTPPSQVPSGQPGAASPLPRLPGGPPAPGRDAPSVRQQSTAHHSRHLCAVTEHGPAVSILDAGPWVREGFFKLYVKRGRAVFPKEGKNGKWAIIRWFDPALTASSSDSRCSEVKDEKLFFHGSQSNCKEKCFPAGLKQVGRCSCLGWRSPAITSSWAAPSGSWGKGEGKGKGGTWGKGLERLGEFVWQREPAPWLSLQVLFMWSNHTLSLPLLTTRSSPGCVSSQSFGFFRYKLIVFGILLHTFTLFYLKFTWNTFTLCFHNTDIQRLKQKIGGNKFIRNLVWNHLCGNKQLELPTAAKDVVRCLHLMEKCFHSTIQ